MRKVESPRPHPLARSLVLRTSSGNRFVERRRVRQRPVFVEVGKRDREVEIRRRFCSSRNRRKWYNKYDSGI